MAGTRPNDFPDMFLGETRLVEFDFSGGAGDNTLVTAAFECAPTGGVTFANEDGSALLGSASMTAAKTGCYTVICTGTLTSDEVIKLTARVKISDPTLTSSSRDYD